MDEAIEQGVSLAWPPPADVAGAQSDPIRFEQQALYSQVGCAVGTVPLGLGGEVFGALCVERRDGPPFGSAELDRLERLLVNKVAPRLLSPPHPSTVNRSLRGVARPRWPMRLMRLI